MLNTQTNLLAASQAIVGLDHCHPDDDALTEAATDVSRYQQRPLLVVQPGSTAEVSALVHLSKHTQTPLVVRGAGTGTTGGAVPVPDALVLDMARFNRILSIDPQRRVGLVEPMVINVDFQAAAKTHGLYYPPDPASLKSSSLGGNVAENAGGLHCVKYGVTRDFVVGLEWVAMDGTVIQSGVLADEPDAAIDLTPLLIGSEGTLAILTKLALRLIPHPTHTAVLTVQFEALGQAMHAIRHIIQSGIVPSTLEFMDRQAMMAVAAYQGVSCPDGNALLLIEVDGQRETTITRQKETIIDICQTNHARQVQSATTPADIEALWQFRRDISPATRAMTPTKLNEDIVVPRSHIPYIVDQMTRLSQTYEVPILCFGHAGDGNIHVNILTDEHQPACYARARAARDALFQTVLECNGSISGEHGIGLSKKSWLPRQLGPATLDLHRRLKHAFDSDHRLNPGKMFDPGKSQTNPV